MSGFGSRRQFRGGAGPSNPLRGVARGGDLPLHRGPSRHLRERIQDGGGNREAVSSAGLGKLGSAGTIGRRDQRDQGVEVQGLTRWWSKPAACERRTASAWP